MKFSFLINENFDFCYSKNKTLKISKFVEGEKLIVIRFKYRKRQK